MKLTNYYEHPSDNRYLVFEFRSEEKAVHFENQLTEASIPFEKHIERDQDVLIFYGVSKQFDKSSMRANFITHGAFRKPLINNRLAKYALLLFTLFMVILAIIGYLKS